MIRKGRRRAHTLSGGLDLETIFSNGKDRKRKMEEDAEKPACKKQAVTTNGEQAAIMDSPQAGPSSHENGQYTDNDRTNAVVNLMVDQVAEMKKEVAEKLLEIPDKIGDIVSEKIQTMVKGIIEQKLLKFREETNKRFEELDNKLQGVKTTKCRCPTNVTQSLKQLETKVEKMGTSTAPRPNNGANNPDNDDDRIKRLVILNVQESETEDAEAKANAVLREGLKLKNVKFSAVERKRSRFQGKSGVIVATCKCIEDKDQILQARGKLCESRVHSNVQIWPDRTQQERTHHNNMRALAQATGMTYQGGRLSQRDRHQLQQPRHPRDNTNNREKDNDQARNNHNYYNRRREGGDRNWTAPSSTRISRRDDDRDDHQRRRGNRTLSPRRHENNRWAFGNQRVEEKYNRR